MVKNEITAMIKVFLYSFLCIVMISSCVTVPREVKPSENNCQLTTKQYTLSLYGNSKPYLEAISEQDFYLANCRGENHPIETLCNLINVTILGISATTFIVSGSIVIVGNTIHWIEKQAVC